MSFRHTLRLAARGDRRALLDKIYAPFQKLDPESKAYNELALSGRVWEDYHKPGDSERMGYYQCQNDAAKTLAEIDRTRSFMKRPASMLGSQMVAAYAHQSVMIENNQLSPSKSLQMYDELKETFFTPVSLPSKSIGNLAKMTPIP